MVRKRKSSTVEHQWKPMTIECDDGLNEDDFNGLVAIEELNDYNIVSESNNNSSKNKKFKANDEKNAKKKSKKKKNKMTIIDVSTNDENEIPNNDEDYVDLDMSEWEKLSVPKPIIDCLRKLRMSKPTPIQTATIPAAINDRKNIYGAAPTGSGKTLAFAIPIVSQIMKETDDDNVEDRKLRSIILTPTRELAVQIKQHIDNICKFNSSIRIALIVGGLAIQKQERILKKQKPQIIVATPGRLWELMTSGKIPYLNYESIVNSLQSFVIDEADRMIEKSHFEELEFIIDFFNKNNQQNPFTNGQCQVFIFSATLTLRKSTKSKQQRLKSKKSDQDSIDLIKMLHIDHNTLKTCDLTDCGKKSKPDAEHLTESIIHCMKDDKDLYLYYFLITNPGRTIVFCNSIDCIRRLLNIFRFLQLNPLSIHSSMPQKRRLTNIERFSSRKNSLIFATDVASRGLDIPNIDNVVHYQVPRTADIYIHRSGRTARINNKGFSLILCDPHEEAFFLRNFARIIQKETINEYGNIDSRILSKLKERLRLAKLCDSLEHQQRKNRIEKNWFKTSANACEILIDSDDDDNNNDDERKINDIHREKTNEKTLRLYQKQLTMLLKKSLNTSTRFLSKR